MRYRLAGPLAVGAMLAVAGVALAAAATGPIKGATYRGYIGPKSRSDQIQFKVSSNGKKVSGFKITVAPISGQGVLPSVASGGSAAISNTGKFSVSLTMYFPPTQPSRHVGTLKVTGTFGKNGKESGTVKSQFSGQNGFKPTADKTVSYSTTG